MPLRRMKTAGAPRKQTKTYKTPKRPYEAPRLDAELKVGFVLDWCWGCRRGNQEV